MKKEEEEEGRLGPLILADDDPVGVGVFGGSAVLDIILTKLNLPIFLLLSFILIKLIKS